MVYDTGRVHFDPGVPVEMLPLCPDAPHPLTELNGYWVLEDPGMIDWKV